MNNTPHLLNSHLLKGPVIVVGNSFHHVHPRPRNAADGTVPVVPDPHVQVPGVKVLKVLIEGDKILQEEEERVRKAHQRIVYKGSCEPSYLLLLSLPSDVALFDVPVAEKVSEVAKDGEDAIAHVGEHSHQEWSLLIVLQKWLLVQATVAWRNILVLEGSDGKRTLNIRRC